MTKETKFEIGETVYIKKSRIIFTSDQKTKTPIFKTIQEFDTCIVENILARKSDAPGVETFYEVRVLPNKLIKSVEYTLLIEGQYLLKESDIKQPANKNNIYNSIW